MSELVTVPKVSGTAECEKHRTISLISHTSKALGKYNTIQYNTVIYNALKVEDRI